MHEYFYIVLCHLCEDLVLVVLAFIIFTAYGVRYRSFLIHCHLIDSNTGSEDEVTCRRLLSSAHW